MGTHDVAWSVRRTLEILAGYAAIFVPVSAVAWVVRRRSADSQRFVAITIAVLVVVVLVAGWRWFPWYEIGRPLPLFVLAIAVACGVRVSQGEASPALVGRSMFTVCALALLAKMILNARLRHYGFVLALPATVLLVETLVSWLPRAIGGSLVLRWAGLAACATVTAALLYGAHLYGEGKTVIVGSGADAFVSDVRGDEVNLALRAIQRHTAPGDTLAVLPQGLMLNYLARRPHPNPHLNCMPPEVISTGEDRIVAAYVRDPPDLVVLLEPFVGRDGFLLPEGNYMYGGKLLACLKERYALIEVVRHPRGAATGFVLLKPRRPMTPPTSSSSRRAAPEPKRSSSSAPAGASRR
jgi:hypothetical protein